MAFKKQSRNHRRFRRPPTSFARRSNAVLNSSSKLLHGPLYHSRRRFCEWCADNAHPTFDLSGETTLNQGGVEPVMPNSHCLPDTTRQCCLCRVRRCELSLETVWQSLNSQSINHLVWVSHTAADGGATTSAIHCWTPSIRCARPHGLELLAGRPPRTAGYESFRQGLKT